MNLLIEKLMGRSLMKIPLAFPITLLVFASAVATGCCMWLQTTWVVEHDIEEHALHRVRKQLSLLHRVLTHELKSGGPGPQMILSAMSSDENISVMFFADDKNVIRAATPPEIVGRSIDTALPSFEWVAQIAEFRTSQAAEVTLSDDRRTVTGLIPIFLDEQPFPSGSPRIGILFEQYNLTPLKTAAYRHLYHRTWSDLLFMIGLVGILWLVFHLLLTRRIARLVSTTERFAAGELDQRTGMTGADELGRLGRIFDEMAAKLHDLRKNHRIEIEERKRAEATLRESEQKFRAIFDQTFQFIGLLSVDGILIEANRTALNFAGVDEAEVLNKPFEETFWWSHSQTAREQLRSALKTAAQGNFVRFETTHPAADGSLHHIDFSIKPVRDERGEVVLLIPEGRDISARKIAEEELKQNRNHLEERVRERTGKLAEVNRHLLQEIDQRKQAEAALRREKDNLIAIFEAMKDEIYIVNSEYVVKYANSALIKNFGPFHGRKCYEYFHNYPEPCFRCPFPEIQNGETVHREETFPTVGKTYDVIETPLPAPAETLKLTIFRDITDRKRAEKELENALRAAKAANRAKSAFLANMSHELRTPLNAILGFTQLMSRDQTLSASTLNNLAIVNRSGEHLLAMINEVLDISKIEAGRSELEKEPFDLVRTLEEVGKMIRSRAMPKGLDLVVEWEPSLQRYLRADLGKLRQVLLNLLDNAVKYTEQGGVTLRAQTLNITADPARCLLAITVEDTGPGIPATEADAIFEPFRQIGAPKKGRKGTGLGLTIARSLVGLMGGELTLETKLGEGALFRVQVPVEIVAKEAIPITRAAESTLISLESEQPERRVLIVEDNPANSQLLETLLTQVGYHVRTAVNGKEGIEAAESWRPHFIWMDMKMPVMDGYQATRKIRASPWGKEIVIYALTAQVFNEQEDKILKAGCNGILRKPFQIRDVHEIMARHLGLHYRYEQARDTEFAVVVGTESAPEPSSEELAALPPELSRQILKAAMELDKHEINVIILDLVEKYPTLVSFIREKAASYQFEVIAKLMESLHRG